MLIKKKSELPAFEVNRVKPHNNKTSTGDLFP